MLLPLLCIAKTLSLKDTIMKLNTFNYVFNLICRFNPIALPVRLLGTKSPPRYTNDKFKYCWNNWYPFDILFHCVDDAICFTISKMLDVLHSEIIIKIYSQKLNTLMLEWSEVKHLSNLSLAVYTCVSNFHLLFFTYYIALSMKNKYTIPYQPKTWAIQSAECYRVKWFTIEPSLHITFN